MAQPIQTHINAYYADLAVAKQELEVTRQKVVELEEAILARGGKLPDKLPDKQPVALDKPKEDTATSDDVSANENDNRKGKK